MSAGRPRRVDPGVLYAFAHQFYWDFRLIGEGRFRRVIDKRKYRELMEEADKVEPTDEQMTRLRLRAEEEIQAGHLKEEGKEAWIRDVMESELMATREFRHFLAADEAEKQVKVPGEAEVVDALLRAKTPEELHRICDDAFTFREVEVKPGLTKNVRVPNWPISPGSVLPMYLSQYAAEFIAAKADRRFPKSTYRPSTRLKQLWFLSRALAGALFGCTARTAINLVGSLRPEEMFHESRDGKPARTQRKRKL